MSEQTTFEPAALELAPPLLPPNRRRSPRIAIAVVVAVALAGISIGYLKISRPSDVPEAAATPETVSLAPAPRLLTLMSNGQVTTVAKDDPRGERVVSTTKCDRIHAAAGTGACLHADGVLGTVKLRIFDRDLQPRTDVAVSGVPSRVRVSNSGRMVAWTAFVGGDDYATLNFSTRTGIYDTQTGAGIKSLETFSVTREGKPYQAIDVNYWGVTFAADDNTFYATMFTDGHRYLVKGDFAARTVRTLRDHVECPSLAPDESRIAFKAPIDGDSTKGWRLSVLDLATGRVTPMAETRSVDDQAAWLDNTTLAYGLSHSDGTKDLWTVRADGSGQPTLLLSDASSPTALG